MVSSSLSMSAAPQVKLPWSRTSCWCRKPWFGTFKETTRYVERPLAPFEEHEKHRQLNVCWRRSSCAGELLLPPFRRSSSPRPTVWRRTFCATPRSLRARSSPALILAKKRELFANRCALRAFLRALFSRTFLRAFFALFFFALLFALFFLWALHALCAKPFRAFLRALFPCSFFSSSFFALSSSLSYLLFFALLLRALFFALFVLRALFFALFPSSLSSLFASSFESFRTFPHVFSDFSTGKKKEKVRSKKAEKKS